MAKKKTKDKEYMDAPESTSEDYKFTSEKSDDRVKKDLITDGETLVEKKEKEKAYIENNLNEYQVDMSKEALKEREEQFKFNPDQKVKVYIEDKIKGKLPVYSVAKGIIKRG